MGPGPPPGAAIRSSTPKVRSSCQPVESSGAKIGMAEFRTASAAKPAPVVDKKAIKHVKLTLDMCPSELNSVPDQDKLTQTAVQSAARSGPPAEHATRPRH